MTQYFLLFFFFLFHFLCWCWHWSLPKTKPKICRSDVDGKKRHVFYKNNDYKNNNARECDVPSINITKIPWQQMLSCLARLGEGSGWWDTKTHQQKQTILLLRSNRPEQCKKEQQISPENMHAAEKVTECVTSPNSTKQFSQSRTKWVWVIFFCVVFVVVHFYFFTSAFPNCLCGKI